MKELVESIEDSIIEQYFERCDFNDECDKCGNKAQEQSYAKMTGSDNEVDYYICYSCAVKFIKSLGNKNITT